MNGVYNSVDTIWVLLGAALVFFMQPGFAMVETGLTRAKNAGNIVMKNFLDFSLGTIVFWIFGFGLMFGMDIGGIIGTPDLFISSWDVEKGTGYPSMAYVIFQTVFCATGLRRDGGTHEVLDLLRLQPRHQPFDLPNIRTLDLGRRLARGNGLP